MASFFHSYDLRGVYPDEIGEEEARDVGRAYGTFTDSGEVLVGRDGRDHGEKVLNAFTDGLRETGVDVLDAGMVPSPVVYRAMIDHDVDAAVVVTASHNPPEYTGFKFAVDDALAVSREGGMKEIEEIYESESFETGERGGIREINVLESYIDAVEDKISLERDLEVAVNFGNGVTSVVGEDLLERLGAKVKKVNHDIDGSFPNHLPDPGASEARKQLRENMEDEDLGIIFDGDGDRAGFMLPGYGYISEDAVLAIFSEELLERGKGRVVHDLRASKLVREKIIDSGGEPVESRVGHTFISEHIHADKEVVFAGELSGHYYFPGMGMPFDDGLFAASLMCQIVSEKDLVKELEAFPDYPVSPELRIDCPEDAKQKVEEKIASCFSGHELSRKDGVKIQFEKGWALVRPSSTEPKMSVRCEADTEEDLDRILSEVEGRVREFIEEAD